MKKILAYAIIVIFFAMMPFVSLARTAITDGEMDAVSAQEGISIEFGDVNINNISLSSISWGDADGFTGYTTAGYFGIKDVVFGSGSHANIDGLMTVDVGTNAGGSKIKIGLPPVEVFIDTLDATVQLDTTSELTGTQPALGAAYVGGLALRVSGDSITISAHTTTQGLELGLNNVTLNSLNPFTASWGDADGFTDYVSAGFAGVPGLQIQGDLITITSGVMTMDLGTSAANVAALNIGLPTIKIGPVNFTVPVKLDSVKDLAGANPRVGTVRADGFSGNMIGSFMVYSH